MQRNIRQRKLVLLHGWMSNGTCWNSVLPYLQDWQTTVLHLPYQSLADLNGAPLQNAKQLAAILSEEVADNSIWVGWSLGGHIAQVVASLYPHKVSHLICVCASLRFVAGSTWRYGMPRTQFQNFVEHFKKDPHACQQAFIALQSMSDEQASVVRKHLRQCSSDLQNLAELEAGLDMLGKIDMRQALKGFMRPVSFIAAENDRVVSVASLKASSQMVANGSFYCQSGSAHAPMLSAPKRFSQILKKCLNDGLSD